MNFSKPNDSPLRYLRWALLTLFLALFSTGSWAAWCTSGGGSYTLSLPQSVAIGRDVPNYTPLTNWVATGRISNLYTNCGGSSGSGGGSGIGWKPMGGLTNTGATYTDGGVTYTLWSTGVTGVGMAIGIQTYTNADCGGSGWHGWMNVSPAGGTYSGWTPAPAGWSGAGCQSFSTGGGNLGGNVQIRLVKYAPITAGSTNSGNLIQGASYVNGALNTGNSFLYYNVTPVNVVVLSCVTPDVPVDMGAHKTTELTGVVGSVTMATSFNISVNSCPPGLNSVSYSIAQTSQILNSSLSVVALSSDSNATGMGLQLLNATGAPFPLNTTTKMNAYNSATGGTYTIPMNARYYETSPTVTAGTANATLTVTLTYL